MKCVREKKINIIKYVIAIQTAICQIKCEILYVFININKKLNTNPCKK